MVGVNDEQTQHDYSDQLKLARSKVARGIYMALGLLCVGSAVVGIFLPGWPTTVWLLVAAWLFSRSSPRFYNRILNHKVFGPIVRDYRAGNGVPVKIKWIATLSIAIFAGGSAFLFIHNPTVRLIVVAVAMFGIGFMVGLPTRKPYEELETAEEIPGSAPLVANEPVRN